MKCKNCGSMIDKHHLYCAECGVINDGRLGKRAALPFVLIIMVCILPAITTLLRICISYDQNVEMILNEPNLIGTSLEAVKEVFYESVKQWALHTLLPNLAGVIVLVCCACCKLIDAYIFRYKDVLVVFLLGFLSDELMGMLYTSAMHTDANVALSIFNTIQNSTTVPSLWSWVLKLVYLFARCGKIKTGKGVLIGAFILLTSWSGYLLLTNHSLIKNYAYRDNLLPYLEHLTKTHYWTIWAIRMVRIYIALLVGQRRMKTGLLVLCVGLGYALTLIIQPILFNSVGIIVGTVANIIAYFFIGLIGISVDIRYRHKERAVA